MLEPLGPMRRLLHSDATVLCSGPDGSFDGGAHGLFEHDCRLLSRRRLIVDGSAPTLVEAADVAPDRRVAVLLIRRPGGDAEGPQLPQDSTELRVETVVGPGMREHVTVHNHAMAAARVTLRLELDADFADTLELRRPRRQRGRRDVAWREPRTLEVRYAARHEERVIERGLRLRVASDPPPRRVGEMDLEWKVELAPRGAWTAELGYDALIDGQWAGPTERSQAVRAASWERWRARRTAIASEPPDFGRLVERAMDDLFALRDRTFDGDDDASWVPSAGVPRYTGIFGRDVLTTGWQAALMGPEVMDGSLRLLAARQATTDDAFRDAQPGKLLHEARRGPLSELGIVPHGAYYGSQTTPSIFVVALSELWHWTGDSEVLRRNIDTARRALRWARECGDADGDGFLESLSRSPEGLANQGWKDSDEAIRYPDGRNVGPPVATVEEQAFHALALERMAEILFALEEDEEADECLGRAAHLRRAWHEAFWLPEAGFYAMALDGDKRPVASIGSNPGHALGAGIVPLECARRVADRLLEEDLFSGWGVRTLSAEHPSFNPFGYHLGTVWPVEQATFALGFRRYGLDEHMDRLVAAMLEAAARMPEGRLPELLSGLDRTVAPDPVPYPESNSPQAWTASATVQFAQILLGLYPFAPLGLLAVVRPRLPRGVETVTLRGLRVGSATVSIRFERRDDGSAAHRVLEQDGRLLVLDAPPPQAVDGTGVADAAKAWAIEHAPGRMARALRIALGLETGA